MSKKYTPGPWAYNNNGHIIDEGDTIIALCTIHPIFRTDEQKMRANARLIAASPDLLTACYAASTAICVDADDYDRNARAMERARGLLKTAIAKATE